MNAVSALFLVLTILLATATSTSGLHRKHGRKGHGSSNRLLMMTRKNSGDTPAQHMMPFAGRGGGGRERRRRSGYIRNTGGGGIIMTASAAAGVAAAPYPAQPVSSMGFAKPDNCPSRSEHSIQGNFDIVLGEQIFFCAFTIGIFATILLQWLHFTMGASRNYTIFPGC